MEKECAVVIVASSPLPVIDQCIITIDRFYIALGVDGVPGVLFTHLCLKGAPGVIFSALSTDGVPGVVITDHGADRVPGVVITDLGAEGLPGVVLIQIAVLMVHLMSFQI